MIFAFEKGSGRCFRTNIINVAQERNYYPKEVERRLATEVEEPANEMLRGIQARMNIAAEDKVTLAYYMATMMKRVPHHRQKLKAMIPEVMEDTFERLYAQMHAARDLHPQYADNIDNHLQRARELQSQYREVLPPGLMVQLQEPWPSPKVVAAISALTWRFGISEGPSYFLTSDNPLFFFECWGVASEKSELTIALSPTIVLHASLQPGPRFGLPLHGSRSR